MTEPRASSPAGKGTADLASVLAALENGHPGTRGPADRRLARARRRRALTLMMMALLMGGVIALCTVSPEVRPSADGGSRASVVYGNARSGTCLSWPPDAPDKPSFVQCRSEHLFEVAKALGADGVGEPCQLAVREYLGARFDPNSRFIANVLWAGTGDGSSGGARNPLCVLQLPGLDGKPIPFTGRISELDQSKVWPTGTCLGIDPSRRSTDLPVPCTAPHALEVTGAVGLGDRFRGGPPRDADQRGFIGEACTRAANAYLAPATLAQKRLVLAPVTIASESWSAGSRQVSCSVGRPADDGWTATTGSVRDPSPADLPPPVAPAPPPVPVPVPVPVRPPTAPPPVYLEPLVPVPTSVPPPGPTDVPTAAPASPGEATVTPPNAPAVPGLPPVLGPAPGPASPPSDAGAPPGDLVPPVEQPAAPPVVLPGDAPPEPAPPP